MVMKLTPPPPVPLQTAQEPEFTGPIWQRWISQLFTMVRNAVGASSPTLAQTGAGATSAGSALNVTFPVPFGANPSTVLVTPLNSTFAVADVYNVTKTGFTVIISSAPGTLIASSFSYLAMGAPA